MGSGIPSFTRNKKTFSLTDDRGINSANVAIAKEAFVSYADAVRNKFATIGTTLEYSKAFFGVHQQGVKTAVERMNQKVSDLLATLESFSSKLDEATSKYAAKDVSINANLSGNNGAGVGGGMSTTSSR